MSANDTNRTSTATIAGEVFTTRDMARLAKLTPSRVRRCVHAGFLMPKRGVRRRFEYSLHDLLVLRATRTLLEARLGPRRVAEVVGDLRAVLPPERDVSSVSLTVEGDEVIVSEGRRRWRLGSGQLLLGFNSPKKRRRVESIVEDDEEDDRAAYRAFTRGLAMEQHAAEDAKAAYREALELDPTAVPAMVNLGRLEHVAGNLDEAEQFYRDALLLDEDERTAAFNLGILAEDQSNPRLAIQRYNAVLDIDPDHADTHHRLARLYARLGRRDASRRHTRMYRDLQRKR
ncbi:MAG: tetratricopeptide repeat protein [Candidatus Binatia bacterium]|nr:tetratricopeptide repeat protein [Candidatus Binatia bacterium]